MGQGHVHIWDRSGKIWDKENISELVSFEEKSPRYEIANFFSQLIKMRSFELGFLHKE